jgi:hypothetical protein
MMTFVHEHQFRAGGKEESIQGDCVGRKEESTQGETDVLRQNKQE